MGQISLFTVLHAFRVHFVTTILLSSEMEKKSRLRGPNFTSSDRSLLCDIISKFKHIIENKNTDADHLIQKQKAWLEITDEFNAGTTGYHRTVESLHQNYKNLKKKKKRSASDAETNIPGKRKQESQTPERQTASENVALLASEKMECIGMQKELLKVQLLEEQEKLGHNRLLRSMELEEVKAKYAHNEKLRKLELEKYIRNKES